MRTRTLLQALTALALVGACSAGGGAENDAPTDASTEQGAAEPEDQVSGTVTLYAAASLEAAFTDLIVEFEQQNPSISVEPPVYDGSSTLVTQLTEGADADVFASAAEANMQDLVAEGLNDGEPVLFATNTLVIAVPPGNPLGIEDLADLDGLDYVVCAPEVPCGAATQTLFEGAGTSVDAVSQEQNVTAVAERVARGEVDAGLVYATDIATRSDVLEAVVPSNADEVVNRYPITTLVGADEAASVFVDFVLSDDGQAVLEEYGFGRP
ncbi:molybdate ABC transporter substrate-binding protein [Pseudactinotalea sp.]|uniref:molybdate ABC transporter substrate-binding protein n=1 Tax=Pseudactinotalea sp. TaxID=1926260 RepID=UPI003B3B57A7